MECSNILQQLGFMDASHLDKLLTNQPDLLSTKHDGKSFLHHAILSGNLVIVSAVLQRNGFSDEPDLEGRTPLLAACGSGQLWTVDQLLTAGADIDVRDVHGAGCVHSAANSGQLTVLQYLREVAGCPLSVEDGEGRTPLMLAAAGGHVAALKYLMEQAGPSLLSADGLGRTALHHAASAGHQHVCWLLVTVGSADLLTATDAAGRAPHQLPATDRSPCGRYLAGLYRRRVSGRGPPSLWPARLWTLLLPGVTYTAALLVCGFSPPRWSPLLNPLLMLAALLTLRGQSHRLSHPSRLPSWFALGAVVALVVATVLSVLLHMKTYILVPAYVSALSGTVLAAFVVTFHRAVMSEPGSAPPTEDLADTLRTAAATPTGQLNYCPHCQVVLTERERHCRLCARCIRGYDHHCLYIVNCVAAGNRRCYLQCLVAAAAGCFTFLGHVWTYLRLTEPAAGRRLPLLAGSDIYIGSCVVGHLAALLLLRSLLSHELTYLWRALPGGAAAKLVRIVRFVAGGPSAGPRHSYTQC